MVIDSRGFNLVSNAAPLAKASGNLVSDLINKRLSKRALEGDKMAAANLSGRSPQMSMEIGGILQSEKEAKDLERQRLEEMRAKERSLIPRIAKGFQDSSNKSGFLQQASELLRNQGMTRLADDVADDAVRYATDPESVELEYEAGLASFTDPNKAKQLTAAMRERNANMKELEGAIDPETGKLKPVEQLTARQKVAAISERLIPGAGTLTTDERQAGDLDTADKITKIKANRKKQEDLAKDSAKLSTEIFQRVNAVEDNISNMEEGIRLIDQGANTGPIDKWLPSFKSSTVQLDNLKNRLGLDVISQVTFGALSEGELRVAFDTAVPPNLNGEDLKAWFQKRIEAQKKLRNSLEDAGIFLAEDGANIPKLMAKRRQERNSNIPNTEAPEAIQTQQETPSFEGFEIINIRPE